MTTTPQEETMTYRLDYNATALMATYTLSTDPNGYRWREPVTTTDPRLAAREIAAHHGDDPSVVRVVSVTR